MTSLGFENYAEALKVYLARYHEVIYSYLCLGSHQITEEILTSPSKKSSLTERILALDQSCLLRVELEIARILKMKARMISDLSSRTTNVMGAMAYQVVDFMSRTEVFQVAGQEYSQANFLN